MLDAKCAGQYLRPCSAALSHWVLSTPNSQRHASHSQRRPPSTLLYQSCLWFGDDDDVSRFRSGEGSASLLVVMQHWMHCQR